MPPKPSSTKAETKQRSKRITDKREAKRRELAQGAERVFCARGLANTSLRDIAEAEGHPLGTYHYYFGSRLEIVIYCVRLRREEFLGQMREIVLAPGDFPEIIGMLAQGISQGLIEEGDKHKLWYEIRNQSLYEPELRVHTEEFEAENLVLAKVLGQRFLGWTAEAAEEKVLICHGAVDGLFGYFAQNPHKVPPLPELSSIFRKLLKAVFSADDD